MGFLWRSEGGMAQLRCSQGILTCVSGMLRNLPTIAVCNQPFLFGTASGVLVGADFSIYFLHGGATPATLATQFLNGAGAVASAGIIQAEKG